MLHIFPKPELKPSKPPKVNHQPESACFQKCGEQPRAAVHGSCGKHSPGGGIHPTLQQNHSDLGKGGWLLTLYHSSPGCAPACLWSMGILPLLSAQLKFAFRIGRGLKFAAGKAPRRCMKDGDPALLGDQRWGHCGEAEVSCPHQVLQSGQDKAKCRGENSYNSTWECNGHSGCTPNSRADFSSANISTLLAEESAPLLSALPINLSFPHISTMT